MTTPRRDWLHTIPPWRMPRIRRHHYHHGHHTETTPILPWLFVAWIFAAVWLVEVEAWLIAWSYYSLFLAARWIWRNNPIGRTIDSVHRARQRRRPIPYDPHAAPPAHIDLAALGTDPWDIGSMRRRG